MKNPKPSSKGSSQKGPSSSAAASDRKSRWEPSDNRPSPKPSKPPHPKDGPSPTSAAAAAAIPPQDRPVPPPHHSLSAAHFPHPDHPSAAGPPPYGLHNLDRRTIVFADGSVRSYFALPPDYPMDPAPDRFFPLPGGRPGFGPEPGFDRHFPPPGGPRFSPEDSREPPPPFGRGPQHDYWSSLGLDGPRGPPETGGGPSSMKRKFGDDDEFAWHRKHVLQYGNPNANPNSLPLGPRGSGGDRDSNPNSMPLGPRGDYNRGDGSPYPHEESRASKQARLGAEGFDDFSSMRGRREEDPAPVNVDKQALKKAFLRFSKSINENQAQRKNYLEDGKNGPLKCIVCDRTSKEFTDVHGLIMHAYNSQNEDSGVDHLGLHKALCVLMGWNYAKTPEHSKAYQSLSDDRVAANREDLIIWPPTVIIHNTSSGRRKDGRMEGLGNKDMDTKLKELGFGGGKSKSMYGKEGHLGFTVVKFANTEAGLKEAELLADYFQKDNHGRSGWARASQQVGVDEEKNPALVKSDKSGEKKRIFYGYLAAASDIDKVDFEMRKKAVIKSRRELDLSD